jgi:NAD(P)-dependent dehydrogenase (short-subunit alcohol dehydrogenase family)
VNEVWRDVGPIRTLVNAAARTYRGLVNEIPVDAWDQIVAVNLSSVYWTCRSLIDHMRRTERGGVIVNMGSIAGVRGLPGSPIYAATKGGVVALSRALAMDHAADGIRINVVTPPAVDTRALKGLFDRESDPVAAKKAYERSEVAGRMLTTAEIAKLVFFLAEAEGPIYSPEPLYF